MFGSKEETGWEENRDMFGSKVGRGGILIKSMFGSRGVEEF